MTRREAWAFTLLLLVAVLINTRLDFLGRHQPQQVAAGSGIVTGADIAVHVLSVGDGQIVLLQCPDRSALIGSGPEWATEAVIDYLHDFGIDRLEAIVIGDTDYDHASGLKGILKNIPAVSFFDASATTIVNSSLERWVLAALRETGLYYQRLRAGQRLVLDCMVLKVLAPTEPSPVEEGVPSPLSEGSGMFLISGGTQQILYAGNNNGEIEKGVIRLYPALTADVLIVGRGGHKSATTQVFLEHVRPKLAIIQVGGYNEEGRPHREVIDRLHDAEVRVLRTDRHGTVVLGLTSQGIRISLLPHLTPNGR